MLTSLAALPFHDAFCLPALKCEDESATAMVKVKSRRLRVERGKIYSEAQYVLQDNTHVKQGQIMGKYQDPSLDNKPLIQLRLPCFRSAR